MAKIVAVCSSEKKGMRKKDQQKAELIVEFGMKNDGHGQYGTHRQISLLALESIKKMQDKGLDVGPGDFAENITTQGIELFTLPVGTRMWLGETLGEISQ
ncbi:MAG: MOSC domain-containing protein, partial [Clostridiales bacterium]